MIRIIFRLIISFVRISMMDRAELALENVFLRQQLAVFKKKHPRPGLRTRHRDPMAPHGVSALLTLDIPQTA
jgi:hypothetical protein